MRTNPEDERQAIATLNACGVKGKDATTALAHVLMIAGDVSYDEWPTATRAQICGVANDEERDRLIARQYGHESVRDEAARKRIEATHDGGALDVIETERTRPGTMITMPYHGFIAMHPLDVIAMTAPSVSARLSAAIGWLLAQALAKLDAANPSTTPKEAR